jgi:hypothetical protein
MQWQRGQPVLIAKQIGKLDFPMTPYAGKGRINLALILRSCPLCLPTDLARGRQSSKPIVELNHLYHLLLLQGSYFARARRLWQHHHLVHLLPVVPSQVAAAQTQSQQQSSDLKAFGHSRLRLQLSLLRGSDTRSKHIPISQIRISFAPLTHKTMSRCSAAERYKHAHASAGVKERVVPSRNQSSGPSSDVDS